MAGRPDAQAFIRSVKGEVAQPSVARADSNDSANSMGMAVSTADPGASAPLNADGAPPSSNGRDARGRVASVATSPARRRTLSFEPVGTATSRPLCAMAGQLQHFFDGRTAISCAGVAQSLPSMFGLQLDAVGFIPLPLNADGFRVICQRFPPQHRPTTLHRAFASQTPAVLEVQAPLFHVIHPHWESGLKELALEVGHRLCIPGMPHIRPVRLVVETADVMQESKPVLPAPWRGCSTAASMLVQVPSRFKGGELIVSLLTDHELANNYTSQDDAVEIEPCPAKAVREGLAVRCNDDGYTATDYHTMGGCETGGEFKPHYAAYCCDEHITARRRRVLVGSVVTLEYRLEWSAPDQIVYPRCALHPMAMKLRDPDCQRLAGLIVHWGAAGRLCAGLFLKHSYGSTDIAATGVKGLHGSDAEVLTLIRLANQAVIPEHRLRLGLATMRWVRKYTWNKPSATEGAEWAPKTECRFMKKALLEIGVSGSAKGSTDGFSFPITASIDPYTHIADPYGHQVNKVQPERYWWAVPNRSSAHVELYRHVLLLANQSQHEQWIGSAEIGPEIRATALLRSLKRSPLDRAAAVLSDLLSLLRSNDAASSVGLDLDGTLAEALQVAMHRRSEELMVECLSSMRVLYTRVGPMCREKLCEAMMHFNDYEGVRGAIAELSECWTRLDCCMMAHGFAKEMASLAKGSAEHTASEAQKEKISRAMVGVGVMLRKSADPEMLEKPISEDEADQMNLETGAAVAQVFDELGKAYMCWESLPQSTIAELVRFAFASNSLHAFQSIAAVCVGGIPKAFENVLFECVFVQERLEREPPEWVGPVATMLRAMASRTPHCQGGSMLFEGAEALLSVCKEYPDLFARDDVSDAMIRVCLQYEADEAVFRKIVDLLRLAEESLVKKFVLQFIGRGGKDWPSRIRPIVYELMKGYYQLLYAKFDALPKKHKDWAMPTKAHEIRQSNFNSSQYDDAFEAFLSFLCSNERRRTIYGFVNWQMVRKFKEVYEGKQKTYNCTMTLVSTFPDGTENISKAGDQLPCGVDVVKVKEVTEKHRNQAADISAELKKVWSALQSLKRSMDEDVGQKRSREGGADDAEIQVSKRQKTE